jgi:SAM-dependent MidA family methyltransferase
MLERPIENESPLKEITERIRGKGPITFAEFMEVALYRPEGGYYTKERSRWGGSGDYVTNLDISPVFARVLARQIHEMWLSLGSPGAFDLVEAGAGRGSLAKGILDTFEELYPDLNRSVRATLLEKNPYLREPPSGRVRWLEDLEELEGPVTGCILSNELMDALPFHRVTQGDTLRELYVGLDNGDRLVDVEGEPSTDELPGYFDALKIRLNSGQKAEVGLKARHWIQRAGRLMDRGFVMTIDYGMPARELYSPGRGGTLMCHYRHTMNDDPYRATGSQDITAHVDFTTLKRAGEDVGLETTGFTLQSYFLLGLGVVEELRQVGEKALNDYEAIKHNQGIKELIIPGGVGDTFKVLVQHKGLKEPSLSGFAFKNMKEYL